MSELQPESVDMGITYDDDHAVNDEDNQQEPESIENAADLATATEEKQDNSQEGVQKAINKKHAQYKEEERRRLSAEDEAKQLREKLEKIEAERGAVTVPDIPDPYDEDYEGKMKLRDDALRKQYERDAQANSIAAQQLSAKEATEQAEKERIDTLVSGYDKQITKLGLNADEIAKAGKTVMDYGISGDVAAFILEQEDGPLITKYLADNPIQLDELANMSPIQAAIKINSTIKAAASANKPQASKTPDPLEILSGNGAGEKISPLIKGATFE